jgi:purine-binding chemotaxis protein CheW
MVDLVKIRKKAREKAQEALEALATPAPPFEAPPPSAEPAAPPQASSPKPVVASAPESPKSVVTKTKSSRQEAPPAKAKPAAVAAPADTPESASPDEAAGEGRSRTKLDAFKDQAGTQRFGEEAVAASAEDETLRELLTFSLAGEHYAIDIESIVEITPPRDVTRIPNAEASVIGIISLRGTIVTVLDLRQILGHPPRTEREDDDARIIVLERKGQTSGILVDRVFRVAKVARHELASHPVVSTTEHNAAIEGVFQHKEVLTIVLNLERLLNS